MSLKKRRRFPRVCACARARFSVVREYINCTLRTGLRVGAAHSWLRSVYGVDRRRIKALLSRSQRAAMRLYRIVRIGLYTRMRVIAPQDCQGIDLANTAQLLPTITWNSAPRRASSFLFQRQHSYAAPADILPISLLQLPILSDALHGSAEW